MARNQTKPVIFQGLEVGLKMDAVDDDTTFMIGFGPLTGWSLFGGGD